MAALLGLILLGALQLGAPTSRDLLELPLPSPLVSIEDPTGQQRLLEATYVSDYFLLAEHFVQQVNGAYCGPASSVVVLNALGVPRPQLVDIAAYEYYDQVNVFTAATESVVPQATVRKQGMSLPQLSAFLAAHPGTSSSFQHTTDSVTLGQFRDSVLSALAQPDMFAIVNFDRALLKEVGGGHHSPIAAYHHDSDSVLVLDVSRYKYPAWWVPLADLFRSTAASHDSATGLPRGLAFVWATPIAGSILPRIGSAYVTPDSDNGAPLPWTAAMRMQGGGQPPHGLPTGAIVGICVAVFALGGVLGWGATTMLHNTRGRRGPAGGITAAAVAGPVVARRPPGMAAGGVVTSHEEVPLVIGVRSQ